MNTSKAKDLLSLLADGIDPYTGEMFPDDSPYQNPDIVRALHVALRGINKLENQEKREKNLPNNVGRAWSDQEDEELVIGYDNGESIKDLSEKHQRTLGAIRSRLIKLGKIIS